MSEQGGFASARRRDIPEASVARLPVYLRALSGLADAGHTTVSSEGLATAAGVNSAKVRKDLSHLGSYGTRGVGYEVDELVHHISNALGLTQRRSVILVGVGNLGHALAGYAGFASRGFRIAGLVDADAADGAGRARRGRRIRRRWLEGRRPRRRLRARRRQLARAAGRQAGRRGRGRHRQAHRPPGRA